MKALSFAATCVLASCSAAGSAVSPEPGAPIAGSSGSSGGGGTGGIAIEVPGGGTAGSAGGEAGLTCADEHTSVGCDFYSARPPGADVSAALDVDGACFAAYVVNVSSAPVTLDVEYRGAPLPVAQLARIPRGQGAELRYEPLPGGLLPVKEVAVLFLTHRRGSPLRCPSEVGFDAEGARREPQGTALSHAFHITSSAPVAAYDIFPFGGGKSAISSATLLLPTRAWGLNHVAVSVYEPVAADQPSILQLVAAEDATEVTLLPTVDVRPGANIPRGSAGVPQIHQLNRGDLLQLAAFGTLELVGSPISASKPIGVWAASGCFSIGGAACDSGHQQIPPLRALGNEYVAVRYPNRFASQDESPPWRIVGAADGTTLTYDPAPPPGAPTVLRTGQMVEFTASGPFSVKSQDSEHPFYLAAYMTGGASRTLNPGFVEGDGRGDPEFVNTVPSAQYMNDYVFFTDPTYPETSLVVTRRKGSQGFADVSLDCLGNIEGWSPVGEGGEYEYAYVTLVSGNFEPQGRCDNGRHEVSSDGKVGVTVWGWGSAVTGDHGSPTYSQYVSYAYPAGASVQAINQVVVPPVVK